MSRNTHSFLAAATNVVEVATKHGCVDAAGSSLCGQIATLGISGAREVRVSSLYAITGCLTLTQIHQIARDLLNDPITQEYRLDSTTPSPAFLLGPHWRIEVWLKSQVTDPVGESVVKAIEDLGLPRPENVRFGTAYNILGRLHAPQVEKIAYKLLANPVIHQTRICST
jgi:phosphoribosylformylglycinamidine (FGAM) synthase PurS component